MTMKKRVASVATALALLMALLPATALAHSGCDHVQDDFTYWSDNCITSTSSHSTSDFTTAIQAVISADCRAGYTSVDGVFGPNTKAAVEDYQTAHGIADDGIVGSQTWSKISSDVHVGYDGDSNYQWYDGTYSYYRTDCSGYDNFRYSSSANQWYVRPYSGGPWVRIDVWKSW